MLSKLLDRLADRGSSVQYEVQFMTHRGGWENFYEEYGLDDGKVAFSEPMEEPTFGENSGWPERRLRCVKRVNGRIQEVVWTAEHPEAQECYEQLREEERQRSRLEEMDPEEVRDAYGSGELDALPREEIKAAMAGDESDESAQEDAEDELSEIEEELIWAIIEDHDGSEGEALSFGMDKLIELERVKQGMCTFCNSSPGHKCPDCGTPICGEHRDQRTGHCPNCP